MAPLAPGIAETSRWGCGTPEAASAASGAPSPAPGAALRFTPADGTAGFTEPIAGLLPGDVVRRSVDLDASGSRPGAGLDLTVTAAGSATLRTDSAAGTKGLRLSVSDCTGPWEPATGVCSGTAAQALPPTVLGPLHGPVPVAVAGGPVHHLQLTLALPDQDGTTVDGVPPATTVQGQSALVAYAFAVTPPA